MQQDKLQALLGINQPVAHPPVTDLAGSSLVAGVKENLRGKGQMWFLLS